MSRLSPVKRCFDILLSILLAPFILPFSLLIAAIIRVAMGSPVLFVQIRPGYRGRPFRIYKFRTMKEASDTRREAPPDHDRLTALGRFLRRYSLDEIPQLLNVIKGDLSFVGPDLSLWSIYLGTHRNRPVVMTLNRE